MEKGVLELYKMKTVPHTVIGRYGFVEVCIKPAPRGMGFSWTHNSPQILEDVGNKDVLLWVQG